METFYTTKRPAIGDDNASYDYLNISTNSSITDLSIRAESKTLQTIQTRQVIITEIADPKTFYVQDVDFKAHADTLLKLCNQCALENKPHSPDVIVVDEMYLVAEDDKSKWYRGIVKENKKFVIVYLVDYGRHMKVTASQ